MSVKAKQTYHEAKKELFKKAIKTKKLRWNDVLEELDFPVFTREEKYKFQQTCHLGEIELIFD